MAQPAAVDFALPPPADPLAAAPRATHRGRASARRRAQRKLASCLDRLGAWSPFGQAEGAQEEAVGATRGTAAAAAERAMDDREEAGRGEGKDWTEETEDGGAAGRGASSCEEVRAAQPLQVHGKAWRCAATFSAPAHAHAPAAAATAVPSPFAKAGRLGAAELAKPEHEARLGFRGRGVRVSGWSGGSSDESWHALEQQAARRAVRPGSGGGRHGHAHGHGHGLLSAHGHGYAQGSGGGGARGGAGEGCWAHSPGSRRVGFGTLACESREAGEVGEVGTGGTAPTSGEAWVRGSGGNGGQGNAGSMGPPKARRGAVGRRRGLSARAEARKRSEEVEGRGGEMERGGGERAALHVEGEGRGEGWREGGGGRAGRDEAVEAGEGSGAGAGGDAVLAARGAPAADVDGPAGEGNNLEASRWRRRGVRRHRVGVAGEGAGGVLEGGGRERGGGSGEGGLGGGVAAVGSGSSGKGHGTAEGEDRGRESGGAGGMVVGVTGTRQVCGRKRAGREVFRGDGGSDSSDYHAEVEEGGEGDEEEEEQEEEGEEEEERGTAGAGGWEAGRGGEWGVWGGEVMAEETGWAAEWAGCRMAVRGGGEASESSEEDGGSGSRGVGQMAVGVGRGTWRWKEGRQLTSSPLPPGVTIVQLRKRRRFSVHAWQGGVGVAVTGGHTSDPAAAPCDTSCASDPLAPSLSLSASASAAILSDPTILLSDRAAVPPSPSLSDRDRLSDAHPHSELGRSSDAGRHSPVPHLTSPTALPAAAPAGDGAFKGGSSGSSGRQVGSGKHVSRASGELYYGHSRPAGSSRPTRQQHGPRGAVRPARQQRVEAGRSSSSSRRCSAAARGAQGGAGRCGGRVGNGASGGGGLGVDGWRQRGGVEEGWEEGWQVAVVPGGGGYVSSSSTGIDLPQGARERWSTAAVSTPRSIVEGEALPLGREWARGGAWAREGPWEQEQGRAGEERRSGRVGSEGQSGGDSGYGSDVGYGGDGELGSDVWGGEEDEEDEEDENESGMVLASAAAVVHAAVHVGVFTNTHPGTQAGGVTCGTRSAMQPTTWPPPAAAAAAEAALQPCCFHPADFQIPPKVDL
ncbi:unnamed protein product [Closterium sp. NIES-65]|nr:unnamed protein product [Closterium sp. NIES-65]